MSKREHPSMLPSTMPPGTEWRWGLIIDGPHAGQLVELPSNLGFARRVRTHDGVFAIGYFFPDTEIRQLHWWDW